MWVTVCYFLEGRSADNVEDVLISFDTIFHLPVGNVCSCRAF